ncbi:MAG TPA: fatty acid desaturase [Trebonia sp.]|nr:fatty acid desaturase [Trebonia sp.]
MTLRSQPASLDFTRLSPQIRRDVRKLCRLDNYHAPLAIAFDYATIAVAVYLCLGVSFWFYPVTLVLIGSTQRALVNILHESSHKVLARNGVLNVLLGTAFSGHLVFHVYNAYRSSHIGLHHRYLGDDDRDPDYAFHREIGIYDPAASNRAFLLRNLLLAVLGLRSVAYLRYVVQDRLLFRGDQVTVSMPINLRLERCLLAAVWAAILVPCALTGSWLYLLLFWVAPMLTTAVAVGWLSELAEHYPLPESETRQILMTRNRHGWLLERFLLGRHRDNYHLVHHLNTGVPFWNMKKAHQVLLGDAAYASWDGLWAGILTRGPGEQGRETVASYAARYRDWRRAGGDPRAAGGSFAELAALRQPAPEVPCQPAPEVLRQPAPEVLRQPCPPDPAARRQQAAFAPDAHVSPVAPAGPPARQGAPQPVR